jgi:hypothetical protein
MASPGKDVKLFTGKPVSRGDYACRRVRCQQPPPTVSP